MFLVNNTATILASQSREIKFYNNYFLIRHDAINQKIMIVYINRATDKSPKS